VRIEERARLGRRGARLLLGAFSGVAGDGDEDEREEGRCSASMVW
jgi:hypothetical protein